MSPFVSWLLGQPALGLREQFLAGCDAKEERHLERLQRVQLLADDGEQRWSMRFLPQGPAGEGRSRAGFPTRLARGGIGGEEAREGSWLSPAGARRGEQGRQPLAGGSLRGVRYGRRGWHRGDATGVQQPAGRLGVPTGHRRLCRQRGGVRLP